MTEGKKVKKTVIEALQLSTQAQLAIICSLVDLLSEQTGSDTDSILETVKEIIAKSKEEQK